MKYFDSFGNTDRCPTNVGFFRTIPGGVSTVLVKIGTF